MMQNVSIIEIDFPLYFPKTSKTYTSVNLKSFENCNLFQKIERNRIYISGQLTDTLTEEANLKYNRAEEYLSGIGRSPVNPLKLNPCNLISWPLRLEILSGCNSIFMLSDWKEDPRSITERFFSEITGKEILYQDTIEKSDVKILRINEAIREITGWIPSDYRVNEKGIDGRGRHKGYPGRLLFSYHAFILGMSRRNSEIL